ncbi:MAG TPA: heparinase II/III family protein [Alphaproteobacteria bacterium]|nr:heparinase II/III family protein [Alphaproteobacteria bacterium]
MERTRGTLRSGLSRLAFGSPLYSLTLGRTGPRDLALVPPDPWPGDADKGASLVDGHYRFAGQSIQADNPLWLPLGVGDDFLAALHGFEWLRDLRALSGDAARRQARFMVGNWIERHDRWHELAWRPDVLGLRVANWLGAHDFFCASADDRFRLAMFASLARQVKHLHRTLPGGLDGAPLMFALKGLIYGSLCLQEGTARLPAALKLLERELPRQILPDGGHVQRNPALHLTLLRHLIDLRGVLRAAHAAGVEVEPPVALQHAIDRMTPALRFYRHGDGGVCLFNGADESEPVLIDAVLAQADARGRPLRSAPHSGFERITAGRTLIVMDAGEPPAPGLDQGAHAGTLSFELSVGRERLIVNCGARPGVGAGPDAAAWDMALRGTPAHSTVTVGDANSSTLVEGGGLSRRPTSVVVDRQESEGAVLIEASHDGYVDRFGITHHRRLYVSANGEDVRGEDHLDGPAGHPFAARFHLHPAAQVSAVQSGAAALIRLGSGVGFRLRISGAEMSIEESVYCGERDERRRTRQIALYGTTGEGGATVKWALKRERKA